MGKQDVTNALLFSTICVGATIYHHLFKKANKTKVKDPTEFKKSSVVVIAGCDTGIGNLLSKELVKKQDTIVVSLCLTVKATDELQELGIHAIQCDITKDDQVQRAKVYIESLLHNKKAILTTLVNNAGIADPGDFVFYPDLKAVQTVMDVNFFGQLRVTQALLPLLLRTSPVYGGRIINMSSVCGASASPGNSSYNASKFAVEAWSDSLRMELDQFNIKVVKIRPGRFSTTIQSDWAVKFAENYSNASAQVKGLYGGESFSEKMTKSFEGFQNDPIPDPFQAVKVLCDLIIGVNQNKLQPYYWIGDDANTFWKALYHLPAHVADSMKAPISLSAEQQKIPPANVISHVTIRVKDLEKSLPFYEAFGLTKWGKLKDGQQFLRSGSSNLKWQTLVLLKEDSTMEERGDSHDAGMTRLCIYSTNREKEVKRLESLGLVAIAPTACDKMASVTAFKDPDGFVVYLIQFKGPVNLFVKGTFWKRQQQAPALFHWTINVSSSIKQVMGLFESLGFSTLSDQGSNEVLNDLLPAFNICPTTTEIEHIRLCHLPNDTLCSTLMQWNNPKTEKRGSELSNTMTMSVDDVDYVLAIAKEAGFTTKEPTFQELPVFGQVLVGTIYIEPKSAPIEVVCYSQKY